MNHILKSHPIVGSNFGKAIKPDGIDNHDYEKERKYFALSIQCKRCKLIFSNADSRTVHTAWYTHWTNAHRELGRMDLVTDDDSDFSDFDMEPPTPNDDYDTEDADEDYSPPTSQRLEAKKKLFEE